MIKITSFYAVIKLYLSFIIDLSDTKLFHTFCICLIFDYIWNCNIWFSYGVPFSQDEVGKHNISHHPFFHMRFITILATHVMTRKNGNDDELVIVAKNWKMASNKNGIMTSEMVLIIEGIILFFLGCHYVLQLSNSVLCDWFLWISSKFSKTKQTKWWYFIGSKL